MMYSLKGTIALEGVFEYEHEQGDDDDTFNVRPFIWCLNNFVALWISFYLNFNTWELSLLLT